MKHPHFLTTGNLKCSGDLVNQISECEAGTTDVMEERILCLGGTLRVHGIKEGSAGVLLERSDSELSLEE